MENKVCPICGNPTRTYMGNARKDGLCGTHADMLKAKEIYLNDEGVYCKTSDNSPLVKVEEKTDKVCMVCGAPTKYGDLCRDCYYEMKDYMDSFDKNKQSFELRDYYFNLKSNIFRMKNFDYVKSNCNKLIALANLAKNVHDDSTLINRVKDDVTDLIKAKQPKENEHINPEALAKDSQKEELLRTEDGHRVKSNGEVVIDDMLYELGIVHCYEKKIPFSDDQKAITCDWFIPVLGTLKGIYIEYWGMSTKEYLINKERKQKAYKEHNIPLIQIEKDEYKDSQGLRDRLVQEINKIAKERFGLNNYIKLF